MTKALILALALLGPVAAMAEPSLTTQAAIAALYVAGDEAQAAVTAVTCDNEQHKRLSPEGERQANHVLNALQAAYDAADGSDASLDIVRADYCAAAYER